MKRKMIASVVILILLLFASALTGCLNGDEDQSTPEGVYESYIEMLQEGDIEGVIGLLDISLAEHEKIDEAIEELREHMENRSEDREVSEVDVIDIRYEDELDEEEMELFSELKRAYRKVPFEMELEDFCVIDAITIYEGEELSGNIEMVKLRGRWYIAMYQHILSHFEDEG